MFRRIIPTVMLLAALPAFAQEPKSPELTPEEQKLAAEANQSDAAGLQLYRAGKFKEAADTFAQTLKLRQSLYPASKHPDGHPDLAATLGTLSVALKATGAYPQALTYSEQALAMTQKLYPPKEFPKGHKSVAQKLNNLALLLQAMGQGERALPYAEQAVTIYRKLYTDGHPDLANSLNTLGFLLKTEQSHEKALEYLRQALQMRQELYPAANYPNGHLDLAQSFMILGDLLQTTGANEAALSSFEKGLAMRRRLYPVAKFPNGHQDIANSLNNLGLLLKDMGAFERALVYSEESVAMRRRLFPAAQYPDGHPALATSLNNLGLLLEALGQYERALQLYEQALAMRQRLYPSAKYPDGHSDLAVNLNNLAIVLQKMEAREKALSYYEQALAMFRNLYPESKVPAGHPHLAFTLNNLGTLRQTMGAFDKALRYYEQALAMRRKLYPKSMYPDGHPDLAQSLINLGFLQQQQGMPEKAFPNMEKALECYRACFPAERFPAGHPDLTNTLIHLGFLHNSLGEWEKAEASFEQALEMCRKQTDTVMATASEAESLSYIRSQPPVREGLLAAVFHRPGADDVAYRAVWDSKAALTRVLELRHAAARVAGTELAPKVDRLKNVRRHIEQLLPETRLNSEARDRQLTELSDERDRLERELTQAIPILKRWKERNAVGHDQLTKLLPPHSAFIDFLRYPRYECDPRKKGISRETWTLAYSAFVIVPGKSPIRVELGQAAPIDLAVGEWRKSIEARSEAPAAAKLHALVWAKLTPHLPPGTTTLFLSPDGDLSRTPWAALPTGNGRVLLEDVALACVPHGPFLIEHLKFRSPSTSADSILILGGLDYGKTSWPSLSGTGVEMNALARIAPTPPVSLTGDAALPKQLAAAIPNAGYAHLATHGFFDELALASEQKRAARQIESWREGQMTQRLSAAKNPLGFTGLVLSNGEVLTGLSLVDLPLENLKLVTLSACETGLGAYTGGEGVQGLQRAFHLAGCPNVVASLWKVNDAATAALMAKFYHELWINKRPPIEALREAQLTIYHHPELIPDLAGERGAPRLKEAVSAKPGEPNRVSGRVKADTKLWAAFVLSGAGR